ncbi:hypothetical protein O7606_13220 [Micromonospora sp. WMMD882]|uniref:hypothetical protein n=1 Tax=Micromonospora sp. WMMD882 TaxID=3015151 RepID=UPI00248C31ED|nr:hypothetical protein [Micromonospora sp. WMMD882]WBB77263.1 hypothetical protein O7606_13220 [Micromonospora sp. WMMD882]
MRQRMRGWVGNPTGGETAAAIGLTVAVVAIVAVVQSSRDAGELGPAQLLGFGLGAAVLVVLALRLVTALRRRR